MGIGELVNRLIKTIKRKHVALPELVTRYSLHYVISMNDDKEFGVITIDLSDLPGKENDIPKYLLPGDELGVKHGDEFSTIYVMRKDEKGYCRVDSPSLSLNDGTLYIGKDENPQSNWGTYVSFNDAKRCSQWGTSTEYSGWITQITSLTLKRNLSPDFKPDLTQRVYTPQIFSPTMFDTNDTHHIH